MSDATPAAPATAPTPSPAAPAPAASAAPTPVVPAAAAGAAPVAAEPPPKPSRKHQLKVDGEVEEVDLDSLKDEDLVRELQMSRAARKRMQESAEVRKQFAEFQKLIKTDPWQAAKLFDVDLEKAAEERLAAKYQEATLPEHERRALQLQRENEALKRQNLEREEAAKAAALQRREEQIVQEKTDSYKSALSKLKIPATPELLALTAEVDYVNLSHNIELTPDQLATEVHRRLGGINSHFVSQMDDEALYQHLGEDKVKRLVRAHVEKMKRAKPVPFTPKPTAQQEVSDPEDDRPKRQMKSVFDFRKGIYE